MRHPAAIVTSFAIAAFITPLALITATQIAHADTFTVSSADAGYIAFLKDNDVSAPILFSTTDPETLLTLTTDSFANLNGFDPTVALFSRTGSANTDQLLGQSSDIDTTNSLGDDVLSVLLPAGDYALYVTQWDNVANGPFRNSGFLLTGIAFDNYTGGVFADKNGIDHTGVWRLTVNTVTVPETGSAALLLPGLTALTAVLIRRRTAKKD